MPTIRGAARARHLARRPAVSLSYFEGETLAVIVHGQARAGEGIYLEVEPDVIYTFEAKS